MAVEAHTTYRALFAIASAATLLPAAAMAAPVPDVSNLALAMREAAAIREMGEALEGKGLPDEAWEAWSERDARFLAWIESLPLTPENAKVKAVAFRHLYPDGIDDFIDGQGTTDNRLALQIIKCVLGGLN